MRDAAALETPKERGSSTEDTMNLGGLSFLSMLCQLLTLLSSNWNLELNWKQFCWDLEVKDGTKKANYTSLMCN